jgi:hypothetical protein
MTDSTLAWSLLLRHEALFLLYDDARFMRREPQSRIYGERTAVAKSCRMHHWWVEDPWGECRSRGRRDHNRSRCDLQDVEDGEDEMHSLVSTAASSQGTGSQSPNLVLAAMPATPQQHLALAPGHILSSGESVGRLGPLLSSGWYVGRSSGSRGVCGFVGASQRCSSMRQIEWRCWLKVRSRGLRKKKNCHTRMFLRLIRMLIEIF